MQRKQEKESMKYGYGSMDPSVHSFNDHPDYSHDFGYAAHGSAQDRHGIPIPDVYTPHHAPVSHRNGDNSQHFTVEHVRPLAQIHDHYATHDTGYDHESYDTHGADLSAQIAAE